MAIGNEFSKASHFNTSKGVIRSTVSDRIHEQIIFDSAVYRPAWYEESREPALDTATDSGGFAITIVTGGCNYRVDQRFSGQVPPGRTKPDDSSYQLHADCKPEPDRYR